MNDFRSGEVQFCNHWFPAKIRSEGGRYYCIIIYSQIAIDHQLVSLNVSLPFARCRIRDEIEQVNSTKSVRAFTFFSLKAYIHIESKTQRWLCMPSERLK